MMNAIDIEALLVRREAVFSQREALDLDGLDMLAAILVPHEDVLEASYRRAEQTGPSPLALRLAEPKQKRKPRLPKAYLERRAAEAALLDDILTEFSN